MATATACGESAHAEFDGIEMNFFKLWGHSAEETTLLTEMQVSADFLISRHTPINAFGAQRATRERANALIERRFKDKGLPRINDHDAVLLKLSVFYLMATATSDLMTNEIGDAIDLFKDAHLRNIQADVLSDVFTQTGR